MEVTEVLLMGENCKHNKDSKDRLIIVPSSQKILNEHTHRMDEFKR